MRNQFSWSTRGSAGTLTSIGMPGRSPGRFFEAGPLSLLTEADIAVRTGVSGAISEVRKFSMPVSGGNGNDFKSNFRGRNGGGFRANFRGGSGRGFGRGNGGGLSDEEAPNRRGRNFRGRGENEGRMLRGANAHGPGNTILSRLGSSVSEPERKEGERGGNDGSSIITSPLESEIKLSHKEIRFQGQEEETDWDEEDDLVVDLAVEAPEAETTLVEEEDAATSVPPSAAPRVSFEDPFSLQPSGGAVPKGFGRGTPLRK